MLSYRHKLTLLLIVTFLSILISIFLIPRIPQSSEYHTFSDSREIFSIPNFYNVVSNFLFIILGSIGIFVTLYVRERKTQDTTLFPNLFFFIGIFFTGLGSSYYHLHPDNNGLLWDRIPMTITFMAFFSIIISEHIDFNTGRRLLFHLLFLGILSVVYWYKTEQNGEGDLRFYALVQFLPMILIPLILILFHSESQFSFYYWCILALYILAKIFEMLDLEIFSSLHFISGHSLKHIFASLTPLIYLMKLWNEMILNKV